MRMTAISFDGHMLLAGLGAAVSLAALLAMQVRSVGNTDRATAATAEPRGDGAPPTPAARSAHDGAGRPGQHSAASGDSDTAAGTLAEQAKLLDRKLGAFLERARAA